MQAGPLSARFESDSGLLRHVRLGQTEVWRGLYVAVRDHNWEVVEPVISRVERAEQGDAIELSFRADCRRDEIQFVWFGSVRLQASGAIRYEMRGQAESAFLKNRIGFCLLHPIKECAGARCSTRHAGGGAAEGRFPERIAPHQPFKGLVAIGHEVAPGVEGLAAFEGDVFETEDQRNWTDASYKTYCTPLDEPFPVRVESGESFFQAVTLSLTGSSPSLTTSPPQPRASAGPQPAAPEIVDTGERLPDLGFTFPHRAPPPSDTQRGRLAALAPAHLRIDLRDASPDRLADLESADGLAAQIGADLDLAICVDGHLDATLDRVAPLLVDLASRVAVWSAYSDEKKTASAADVTRVRERVAGLTPGARCFGGTRAYFAELNRNRPAPDALDGVTYSINPQVHAFDDLSLVETLEAQGQTVTSAQALSGGLPVAVAPITLRPQFNPNATAAEPPPPPGHAPPRFDPRQTGLFAAGWTLGSVAQLGAAGASRLTYYETHGLGGLLAPLEPSPFGGFSYEPGGVFPLYHVFQWLSGFRGAALSRLDWGRPLEVSGVALRSSGAERLMVANHTGESTRVGLPPASAFGGVGYELCVLDADSLRRATAEPETLLSDRRRVEGPSLGLAPHAVVVADVIRG